MNKDYRLTLKISNANLLRAIEAAGELPGQKFAEKVGITYSVLNSLIRCKISPVNREGDYRSGVISLCEYLNKMPCELFSPEQLEPLERSIAEIDLSYGDFKCLANAEVQTVFLENMALPTNADPADQLSNEEVVARALSALPERTADILKGRYGIGRPAETLESLAEKHGVSIERIRGIEAKALRRLRSPALVGHTHGDPGGQVSTYTATLRSTGVSITVAAPDRKTALDIAWPKLKPGFGDKIRLELIK